MVGGASGSKLQRERSHSLVSYRVAPHFDERSHSEGSGGVPGGGCPGCIWGCREGVSGVHLGHRCGSAVVIAKAPEGCPES